MEAYKSPGGTFRAETISKISDLLYTSNSDAIENDRTQRALGGATD